MITVQIPAAIRICSPVYVTDGLFARASGIVGDGGALWRVRFSHTSAAFISADHLALIISDPTGAAHLAWWLLYTVRWTMTEHAARIEAMGWTLAGYQAAVDCAAHGLPADIERLRDYALRVVSHG